MKAICKSSEFLKGLQLVSDRVIIFEGDIELKETT